MTNAAKKVETVKGKAAANLNEAGNLFKNYVAAVSSASRIAVEGTIEVDKLILNKFGEAARETVQYGKDLMGARDIKTAGAMAVDFTHARVNKNIADTKEVLDLAQTRIEDVIEPFKAQA